MPGIMYHCGFANEVYRYLEGSLDKKDFFAGNLIPDLALDKKASHYRMPASISGFFVPFLKQAKEELFDKNDAVKLGMYCHLYYDFHFIEDYLIPSFIWDSATMQVINPRNGNKWPVSQFFAKPSQGGILYNGYTQINKLLVRDNHISMETLNTLPDELPLTGLPTFDERRELTWREELNKYLAEDLPYTGEALDYTALWDFTCHIADKFVSEELSNVSG